MFVVLGSIGITAAFAMGDLLFQGNSTFTGTAQFNSDVNVDGTLTGADIDSSTTVTATQFEFNPPITKTITFTPGDVSSTPPIWTVPMHTIPDGAQLTNARCLIHDTTSSGEGQCALREIHEDSSFTNLVVLRSGIAFDEGFTSPEMALTETLDRTQNSYTVLFFQSPACGCSIRSLQVTYTISHP